MDGRDFVVPDDVKELVQPVLAHRLILAPEAQLVGRTTADVLATLVERVPVPVSPRRSGGDGHGQAHAAGG